ncbi:rRNA maturation RNase YbeY [Candidatus Collierbacteria bacterium RIFOXYB2_FULL_46_14]|uniref:Endoribonuclease YbeY n=1 Tax=Candidatus Collierbacteria bacterium GW2011_GWA2_46_26 TaxID=1618381 RepID=A0A0G1PJY1_9BACT|nr:MAG: putative rRNA maturation factor [Candidatus Collierbacteria bacterium GW2011_GWC2_44_13]KKU33104.1 MAG: putative rRNA maturation factor [Candidatus Collierbacteria bacterium GW2011_GWA2_46_26]OGD73416.1 MAG: rRNA maturation RNase YbeY [Candidatus Collierbacteria bacterium RIFOXYB2_FULL_46_14]OGD76458.1 MAG: rRNA maturation RNase YbeY [Candidatus Collierbacteria bacterium RIFOXYA2_FULL_46_20]OGD77794.1 MAG: rRNA maturation RNase YbeY [Candidatus Collierbacteria bacterium RIFOXYC2_FULL_43
MLKLDLSISADSRYSFDRKRVKAALSKVLMEQGLDGKVMISFSVVGERKIRELEQKYFNLDEVTDVLSFPLQEGEEMPADFDGLNLGDIVVCYPQAKRQAMQWNRLVDEEIEFLACHGLLHLLGIHHD